MIAILDPLPDVAVQVIRPNWLGSNEPIGAVCFAFPFRLGEQTIGFAGRTVMAAAGDRVP